MSVVVEDHGDKSRGKCACPHESCAKDLHREINASWVEV